MAKDLRLDVVTSGDTKGLLSTAGALDEVADKADKVGTQFKETAVDGGILAAELEAVKLKSAELARTFDNTGDKALLRQISRNQTYERQLKRVGTALEDVGKDVAKDGIKVGEQAGQGVSQGIGDALTAAGPEISLPLTVALVGAAVEAAPVVGAMVGGAVVAGIGLAGIGAGIGLALQDPAAKAALASFKTDVGNTLKDAAQPFVAPLETALERLGANIQTSIGPGLKSMFTELAPEVLTLEKGVEGFLDAAIPGFEKAAVAAKPLLEDLGNTELPQLGAVVAKLFSTIADNAPEAELGLKLLFLTVETGIEVVRGSIDVLSFLFDKVTAFVAFALSKTANLVDALDGVAHFLHLPTDGLDNASAGLDAAAKSANAANDALKGSKTAVENLPGPIGAMNTALNAAVDAIKSVNQQWDILDKNVSNELAIDAAKDAISGLTSQIDKHNKSLNQDNATARKNREAYVQAIQTLKQQRDQLIANGDSAADADKKFQGWVKALDKAAAKAGLSKKDIDKLNRSLGLPITKTVTVKYNVRDLVINVAQLAAGSVKKHATGGTFLPGDDILVGETGPEVMHMDHGGSITPRAAANTRVAAGGGGGGQTTTVILQAQQGDQLAEFLLSLLRPVVQGRYGNNVQLAVAGRSA